MYRQLSQHHEALDFGRIESPIKHARFTTDPLHRT